MSAASLILLFLTSGNTLPNGDIYVGNFAGLVPHGFGKYMWTDGTLYCGEWDANKMTGKGLIQWPSGASYDGDVCGGFIDGTGTFKGVDGSVYKGSWRMNKKHGMGTMFYANSDTYEGFWNEVCQMDLVNIHGLVATSTLVTGNQVK